MNNYDWLISRLDAFIRKYYANQVIRGTLIFLSCLLAYILAVSVGEYFLYLPVWIRVGILSLFIILGSASLIIWVIIPLAKMARLGKLISHEQAASIVGRHFAEINDKLLNILQLKSNADPHASRELIEASIDQKAKQLSVVPFSSAIDFSKNKKYLPFLLPVLLVGVFILVAAPNVFKDASSRLLQPTKKFEKPAPFQFVITTPLKAIRNADFVLNMETKGNALPAEMFLEIGTERIPMQALQEHTFEYTFRNVTEAVEFRFYAAGFYSQPYTLTVVQKPVLKSFKVQINYPAYTGRKDEIRNNMGDMSLPIGTKVNWIFMAEHTDEADIRLGNGAAIALPKNLSVYAYGYRFMNDTFYTFILQNNKAAVSDSFRYMVQVIPDQYPVLQVQEFKDSVSGKQILLNGTAGDDYGISKVLFHYDISDSKNQPISNKSIPVNITAGALTNFQYYFDIESLNLKPGQKLSYFIEAWDNDGVHGSKATRSEVMTYKMYNEKQIDSAINENSQQINSGISNSSQKTQQLQSEIKDMQTKMLQSENMDWEQQQSLQEMTKKQQQLQNQLENVQKRFDEQKKESEQKPFSQDLKDKQDELQKQLDNLLNKELKEQMKKLQDLMAKLNKEDAFKEMKEMEQENKLFDMDLKRMQELMKKLEMQMRMEDMANKLDDLAKKQLDLKKETDKNADKTADKNKQDKNNAGKDSKDNKDGKDANKDSKDNQALKKEQDSLKKELAKTMNEDMKEMSKANDKLEEKQSLEEPKEEGKKAEENMQQSEDALDQGQESKSSGAQSKAAQNMKEMAEKLREGAGGMGPEQIEIDIKATRQILTNLIRLSFGQEDLMNASRQTSIASQTYLTNIQEQKRLHSNSQMIRDSLFVLSKRVASLAANVNKETTDLEKNMAISVDALEDRRLNDAITRQQYVMTHTNNLALMLNELLANLIQQQNEGGKPSMGSCSNPGGKKPKPGAGKQLSDIITKQQQLGDAMQQMQNAMKKKQGQGDKPGDKPGDKAGDKQGQKAGDKPGNGGGGQGGSGSPQDQGEYGDAEQLARLAQQQAAIRKQLQELNSLLNSKGVGDAKSLQELQQKMDKTETDLVNRRLSDELQLRQKEILTRLLETQKSLREQEQDDKRSSNSAKEISRPVPPELQKYMQDRQQMLELYKTVPPQLKPYYRTMVEQYFQTIGK